MAEYGLLCSKLRDEGLGVVADVIEKIQGERDAAVAHLRELAECEECVYCDAVLPCVHDGCYAYGEDCDKCEAENKIPCCTCNGGEHWEWKGAGAETAAEAESAPDDPRVEQFLRDSYK